MHYLIRYPEIGKEPHPEKLKARRDIVESLERALGEARISVETGRIFVETERDATDVIAQVHGITSFSPCEKVPLSGLEAAVVAMARAKLEGGRSFAIKVKRVGDHDFSSQSKAAELGAKVNQALGAPVDLSSPEVTLQIEIRGPDCYLYDRVIAGRDPRTSRVRPRPEGARFIVDHMLGTLATRLRMLGFDTSYYRDTADCFLLRKSNEEGRILLTQDRELAGLGGAAAYLVRAKTLEAQVAEVRERFGLSLDGGSLFSRCSVCNGSLEQVDKAEVERQVPAKVLAQLDEFFRCSVCDKVYWKGTHYERFLSEISQSLAS